MGASARVGWTAVIAQTGDDFLIGLAGSEQRLPAGGADGPIILIVAPLAAGTSAGAIDALKDNAKETVKVKAADAKLGGLARKQVAWRAGGELQACCGRVPHLRLHARVGAAAAKTRPRRGHDHRTDPGHPICHGAVRSARGCLTLSGCESTPGQGTCHRRPARSLAHARPRQPPRADSPVAARSPGLPHSTSR